MSLSAMFFDALRSFLIKRATQPMLNYTLTVLDDELRKLTEDSPPPEWTGSDLTAEQREFIAMLPALHPSRLDENPWRRTRAIFS
ncbi:MAG: hypothetical protein R6X02_10180 [Enhygromyxa sp.]